jgi:biopolymer transport protein TolQ
MLTEKLFTIAQGGAEAILWVLLLLSVLSIGIILERFITLRLVKRNSERIQKRVRETLQSHNLQEIEELSKDRDSLEGRALSYGLRHIKENGSSGLEEIFNSYALSERPMLERSLNFLATVGSNAPFIGLLGTVLGIMKAFRDLSQNVGAGNEAVMLGIAEALVSTAVGLVVAIPAVIAYNYFQRQVRGTLQSLEGVKELCVAYAKQKGRN